jgi:exosortase family protein XrtF
MSLLKKNRPFFIFLLKFGLSYLLLSVLYWLYLGQFDAAKLEPDGMTTIVAKQAVAVGRLMGADASIVPHPREASYRYLMNGKSVMRIVEGCNAVSVMILFVAFVVAFTSTLKRTSIFIFTGVAIIHILNIIRVALLGFGFYYYPEYKELLHDIIFPLFIYGVVFILWILWVTKFSIHEKHIAAK